MADDPNIQKLIFPVNTSTPGIVRTYTAEVNKKTGAMVVYDTTNLFQKDPILRDELTQTETEKVWLPSFLQDDLSNDEKDFILRSVRPQANNQRAAYINKNFTQEQKNNLFPGMPRVVNTAPPAPEITCPCGRKPNLLSVQHATIQPTNERNNMEETVTIPAEYNANILVTYKDIVDGVATFPTIKVNDLEWKLERIKRLEDELSRSNGTIRKIMDNLTEESWFNPNTEKEEILNDLCTILDYEPKKEVQFEGTIYFSGRIDVPLAEYEDFDIDDYVNDITVDCYNGNVIIDEYHTEEVRES